MTNIGQVPNRPAGTDARSISAILADFDYITNDYNGNIDTNNIATSFKNLFLKLKVAGDRKVAMGNVAPGAWGGVAQIDTVIPHTLAADPLFADAIWQPGIATVTSGGVVLPIITSIFAKDATNITIRSRTADGGTTNNASTLFWIAIG